MKTSPHPQNESGQGFKIFSSENELNAKCWKRKYERGLVDAERNIYILLQGIEMGPMSTSEIFDSMKGKNFIRAQDGMLYEAANTRIL